MKFENVALLSITHALPEEVVTSAELEQHIAPLYDRLGLSIGRLELMTGIRERRFWPRGTRPSTVAAQAGEAALSAAGVERAEVGMLIHTSVCRDFLEPATASVVHHRLGLGAGCHTFDLSNACLGFANGMVLAAGAIERGEIEAALLVAGEDGRPLVEETLRMLAEPAAGRRELKRAFTSLTIGAGAAAAVLVRADRARPEAAPRRLVGATVLADTSHHELCSGDSQGAQGPLMETDSEALLHAGNDLARRTFAAYLDELAPLGWSRDTLQRVVTHQVGVAHRKLLFETLQLEPALDFPTVEKLGNIGSVSLPLSLSKAIEAGLAPPGERIAMLGIGSGLHCAMLAVQ
jgi:3-oxoacyl-[acyl-carrier-protein] synthase-3